MRVRIVVLTAVFAFGGALGALAADRIVGQKGKTFSESAVTIRAGDTLIMRNDDDVTHNILSTSPGNEFNMGAQAPGISTPLTFNTAGQVKIMCAIHPRMQMAVTVEK